MRLLLALLGLLAAPLASVQAHKLELAAVPRPGWRVQVECWYETGDSPRGARVQVFGAAERLLAEGRVDDRGIYLFSYDDIQALRIVVNAGAGHREELRLPRETLVRHAICTCVASLPPTPAPFLAAPLLVPIETGGPSPAPVPVVVRSGGVQWVKVLLGVGVLVALAVVALVRSRRERLPAARG